MKANGRCGVKIVEQIKVRIENRMDAEERENQRINKTYMWKPIR